MLLQAAPECRWLNPVAIDLFAALCQHLRTCPSHVYTELELALLDMVETAVAFGQLARRVQTEDDTNQAAYAAQAAHAKAAAELAQPAMADPDSRRLRERYGKGDGIFGPTAAMEDQPRYRAKRPRRPL